jgi:hypothetical protein
MKKARRSGISTWTKASNAAGQSLDRSGRFGRIAPGLEHQQVPHGRIVVRIPEAVELGPVEPQKQHDVAGVFGGQRVAEHADVGGLAEHVVPSQRFLKLVRRNDAGNDHVVAGVVFEVLVVQHDALMLESRQSRDVGRRAGIGRQGRQRQGRCRGKRRQDRQKPRPRSTLSGSFKHRMSSACSYNTICGSSS